MSRVAVGETTRRNITSIITAWNADHSKMCSKCTTGRLFRPGERYPYLTFDPTTIRDGDYEYLVDGICTDCTQVTVFGFLKPGQGK